MHPIRFIYRKVPKVTTHESSEAPKVRNDKMSQVLANPEISDPPENNDPLKVEISNPEQIKVIKCHTTH